MLDTAIELFQIRNLIKRDPNTQNVKTFSFFMIAFVMLILFVNMIYAILYAFGVFSGSNESSLPRYFFILAQLAILYFAWSVSYKPKGQEKLKEESDEEENEDEQLETEEVIEEDQCENQVELLD